MSAATVLVFFRYCRLHPTIIHERVYILLDDKKKYINEFYFSSYNIYYIINIFVYIKKKKKFLKNIEP